MICHNMAFDLDRGADLILQVEYTVAHGGFVKTGYSTVNNEN